MSDAVADGLIFDLLERLAICERTYKEVIDIGLMSCPRLPVWEDAKRRGFVASENPDGREVVRTASAGSIFLHERKAPASCGACRPA